MSAKVEGRVHWGAAALGWLVAVAAGVLITPLLRLLYGLAIEPPIERGEFTTAVVAFSLLSGFLAYLLGGYIAARLAGRSGGLNGAMTAVFGILFGVFLAALLSTFGLVFAEGVTLPPAAFGMARTALVAGLVLFAFNLFGGYVGGKLGEPSRPQMKHTHRSREDLEHEEPRVENRR